MFPKWAKIGLNEVVIPREFLKIKKKG